MSSRIQKHLLSPLLLASLVACVAPSDDRDEDSTSLSWQRVTSMPRCTPPPSGMIGWWPGDSNPRDIVHHRDGIPFGDVSYAPASSAAETAALTGKVAQAFIFNGKDAYLDLPDEVSATGLTAFTLDAWVNVSPSSDTQYIYSEQGEIGTGARVQFYVQADTGKLVLDVKPYDDPYPGQDRVAAVSDEAVTSNEWVHVAGVWRTGNGVISATVYVNGQATSAAASAVIGAPIADTPPGAGVNYIGGSRDGLGGTLVLLGMFAGGIDEVEFFHRALNRNEVQAIYMADTAGKCKVQLHLPWTAGETWFLTSGPHGTRRSALDFAPPNINHRTGRPFPSACSRQLGDQHWVRAAAPGTLLEPLPRGCPLVQIKHDDGTITNYFHLRSRSVRELGLTTGSLIHAGQILGHPSCEIGHFCGTTEQPSGVHVHFYRTDSRTNARLSADDLAISGWTVHAVGANRDGTMTRDADTRTAVFDAEGHAIQCPPDNAPSACRGQRNDLESDNTPDQ